jgi:hypothetical protein
MLKKGNVLALFIFVVISFISIPFFGGLYEKITGTIIDGGGFLGWGSSAHPEYFEGFFLSTSLIITFGIIIFTGKLRYKIFGIFFGLELLLLFIPQAFESLIVDVCAAAIAIILGELILFINRRVAKIK